MASFLETVRDAYRRMFGRTTPRRPDGWENSYTGYGTWRDKTTYGAHYLSPLLNDEELASLFYTDDIASKIVEKRPEEAFRRGYTLENASDQSMAAELLKQGRALDIDGKMQEAWTWARCFGSAFIVIGAEGGNPAAPLRPENAREIRFLNVVDRRHATVVRTYGNPLEPNYGEPELYRVWGVDGSFAEIHESRVIRFDGLRVDVRKRRDLGGWSYSVLQRPYDVLRQFSTAFAAAGVLTAEASQAVFKLKGLMQMVAAGEKDRLQARMQLVDMSRSAARSVLIDADGEDFTRIQTTFNGLPEMLDRFAMRLAASIDMPVTLLMGTSPAGDNATGASDFKHWYDSIAAEQTKILTPKLLRFYDLLSRGRASELEICWLPLEQPSEREEVEIEKIRTETRSIEIKDGVLFPEEVALAKYGKSGSGEIEIDEEGRKTSLEAEKELALNPPPVEENSLGAAYGPGDVGGAPVGPSAVVPNATA